MSFNLSFNISEGNECKNATLQDTTCHINLYNKYTCCDGYGVDSNIKVEDVDHTRFNFKFPDGTEYNDVDLNWVPGTKAKGEFQITGGTDGVIVVDIEGLVIGQAIFTTDLDTTIALLIQSINSIAADTGWQAYLKDGTTDTIVIAAINYGVEYNSRTINIGVSGDITIVQTSSTTDGANGNTCSFSFNTNDIYGITEGETAEFPDGVYEITYILYDAGSSELARVTNTVLFTCKLKCIIRKFLLLPVEDKCVCTNKFDKRLLELRLMLERAEVQMSQCLYDCANETIKQAHKMATGICLDC